MHLNPVFIGLINYQETGDMWIDLRRLANGNEGLESAHAWRELYKADWVCLITELEREGVGGWAWDARVGDGKEGFDSIRDWATFLAVKSNRRLIDVRTGISDKEEAMGEVRVQVRLTNAADESLARRGQLQSDGIRSVTVEAVVDTSAVRCVIPAGVREQLGLQTTSRRNALYADGRSEEVDVTEPVRLELEGRPTYEDCLVLGDTVLIGQTALESTDLFVDCVNGRLVPNPAHPNLIVSPVRAGRVPH